MGEVTSIGETHLLLLLLLLSSRMDLTSDAASSVFGVAGCLVRELPSRLGCFDESTAERKSACVMEHMKEVQ